MAILSLIGSARSCPALISISAIIIRAGANPQDALTPKRPGNTVESAGKHEMKKAPKKIASNAGSIDATM
jgi:hypothetical protein